VLSDPDGPELVPNDPSFDTLQFTSDEVAFCRIWISTKVPFSMASALAKPLSLLFNMSLATSAFFLTG
jgi:hypothetical protein